jgi:hypothetical protein
MRIADIPMLATQTESRPFGLSLFIYCEQIVYVRLPFVNRQTDPNMVAEFSITHNRLHGV